MRHLRLTALLLGLLLVHRAPAAAADTYVAPQADFYITHSDIFRSHVVFSGNYLTQESRFSSAWAQYDIDIGLASFFRRYVFKDPNTEKSKRLSFRLGYLQVTDLNRDVDSFEEKRPLAEVVIRQPVGRSWLFEDRNRGEHRMFHDDESLRYRNRLRIERNIKAKGARLTPYTTGEVFYDGDTQDWNEFQGALGIDIPWHHNTVIELECMAQIVNGNYASLSFGFVFQKYLTWTPSRT